MTIQTTDPRVISALQRCGTQLHSRAPVTEQELRAALAAAAELLGECAAAMVEVSEQPTAWDALDGAARDGVVRQSCAAALTEARIKNLLRR